MASNFEPIPVTEEERRHNVPSRVAMFPLPQRVWILVPESVHDDRVNLDDQPRTVSELNKEERPGIVPDAPQGIRCSRSDRTCVDLPAGTFEL